VPDSLVVDYSWLVDPSRGDEQIRVIAWHMARGRAIVAGWPMPDAARNAARWADARYAWGGGNLREARARFVVAYGTEPSFDELAAFEPDAGKPNVRPWRHADALVDTAARDRGEEPTTVIETVSKKKVIAEIAIGAAALLALVLVAVGVAKLAR
jgi:hypothetical protein